MKIDYILNSFQFDRNHIGWIKTMLIITFLGTVFAAATDLIMFERRDSDSPTKIYIPADLKEAVRELNSALSTDFKADIRSRSFVFLHSDEKYELLDWMVDAWALDKKSKLAEYFEAHELVKPYAMARAVLAAWEKRQRNEILDVESYLKERVELEKSLEEYAKQPPGPDGLPPPPPDF